LHTKPSSDGFRHTKMWVTPSIQTFKNTERIDTKNDEALL